MIKIKMKLAIGHASRQCDQFGKVELFWQYFKSLRLFYERGNLVLGKNLNLLWSTFYAIGQSFILQMA